MLVSPQQHFDTQTARRTPLAAVVLWLAHEVLHSAVVDGRVGEVEHRLEEEVGLAERVPEEEVALRRGQGVSKERERSGSQRARADRGGTHLGELEIVQVELAREQDAQVAVAVDRHCASIDNARPGSRRGQRGETHLVDANSQHRPELLWFVTGLPSVLSLTLYTCLASTWASRRTRVSVRFALESTVDARRCFGLDAKASLQAAMLSAVTPDVAREGEARSESWARRSAAEVGEAAGRRSCAVECFSEVGGWEAGVEAALPIVCSVFERGRDKWGRRGRGVAAKDRMDRRAHKVGRKVGESFQVGWWN